MVVGRAGALVSCSTFAFANHAEATWAFQVFQLRASTATTLSDVIGATAPVFTTSACCSFWRRSCGILHNLLDIRSTGMLENDDDDAIDTSIPTVHWQQQTHQIVTSAVRTGHTLSSCASPRCCVACVLLLVFLALLWSGSWRSCWVC